MGHLPIPAADFFKDFAFDVLEYKVLVNNAVIGTYQGLSNTDEDGNYIGFLMKDQPKISIGDTITTIDGLESFNVRKVSYDRYKGNPELLKAYY